MPSEIGYELFNLKKVQVKMMSDQWFIYKEGKQTGPYSFAQLQEEARAGRLIESDLIWAEGFPDWQPASTVENLFSFKQYSPPPPAKTQKKGGSKKNILIAGGVLLGLLLLLVVSVLLSDKPDTAEPPPLPTETEAPTPSSNLGEEQNITPAPEENQVDDSLEGILKLVLPTGEQLANEALSEKYLLYAHKESNHVYVYSRDLQKGTETLIFDFFEFAEYEGDYRPEPPALSVSPDGTKVAFTDKEGLKVYFLSSGQVAKYIYKVKFETGEWGDEERTPAVWSEAAFNINPNHFDSSIVSLSEPRWSYDGNYISFLYSSMIDSGLGAYEIKDGRYLELEWGAISWSPVENSYILSYAYGGGFYKSVRDDPTNISPLFQDQFAESEVYFSDSVYSADGSKIAFIYSDGYGDTNNLALAKADGSGFVQIATNGLYSNPFFSPDGKSIYYFKQIADEQVLLVRELAGGETSKLLIMPDGFARMYQVDPNNGWFFEGWTTEGYLTFIGRSYQDFETTEARLIVVDPDSGKIIYAGPSFKGFATFGAFSKATY